MLLVHLAMLAGAAQALQEQQQKALILLDLQGLSRGYQDHQMARLYQ